MRTETQMENLGITVPAHREIAKGTPNDILNQVAPWIKMPKEQFPQMIREI